MFFHRIQEDLGASTSSATTSAAVALLEEVVGGAAAAGTKVTTVAYPGEKLCKCNSVGKIASQIRFALQGKPVMRSQYVKTPVKVTYDADPV